MDWKRSDLASWQTLGMKRGPRCSLTVHRPISYLILCYLVSTSPAASCRATYRIHPCGKVDVILRYDPVAELGDMPEFGMITKLSADLDRVRFYGLGPLENYTDRREGARLGIWDYRAGENLTPYLMPQECGNRTGIRWAEITDARGKRPCLSADYRTRPK